MLGSLVVHIGLSVVCLLIELVANSVTGSLGSGANAGIAILSDVLVGLLGSGGSSALDGLANVVCGVPMKMLVYSS